MLSAFSTIKLDERRNRSKWAEEEGDKEAEEAGDNNMEVVESPSTAAANKGLQKYFAKYLTSQNLLELQLGDSNFRRYILLQFLILFQYLDAPVKAKK